MTVLIQLGSCGASWPENTTPIQRLKAILPYFSQVILADTAPGPNPHLYCSGYVQLSKFTPFSILRILRRYREEGVVVWFGPSPRIAMIVLFLRLFVQFRFVLDLYDHEQLSSGIARARGLHFKALKYRIFEAFTAVAARRADLLVSAIAEERYVNQENRVKAINGVASSTLGEMIKAGSFGVRENRDSLVICYVGLVNAERAGLFRELASASYGVPVEMLLIGDNDPAFIEELRQRASFLNEVSIVAPGFVPWHDAMRFVAEADLCLYVFPARPELDCVYPIKVGEYMEMEKPVIATDSTAMREVYSRCSGVIRCDVQRPEDWIYAVQSLANDPEKRRILGCANRAFSRERLDWRFTQAELLESLRTLLVTNSGQGNT